MTIYLICIFQHGHVSHLLPGNSGNAFIFFSPGIMYTFPVVSWPDALCCSPYYWIVLRLAGVSHISTPIHEMFGGSANKQKPQQQHKKASQWKQVEECGGAELV